MFRKLAALGLSHEQMAGVLAVFEEQEKTVADADEARKKQGRERWHRWNEKRKQTLANVSQREQTLANDLRESVARGEDNLQTKKISGQEEKKDSAAKPRVDLDAFRAELSPILDIERIEALIAVRRKKGATMTPHAGRLLAKALRQCPDPCAAADEMVLRNWTGIKPEWLQSRSSAPRQSTDPPHQLDRVNAILDEIQGKSHVPQHTGPSIDGSVERTDRGGAPNLVQLHAVSAWGRS